MSENDQDERIDPRALRGSLQTLEGLVRFRQPLQRLQRLEEQLYRLPSRLQLLHDRAVQYRPHIGQQVARLTGALKGAAETSRTRAAAQAAALEEALRQLWQEVQQAEEQTGPAARARLATLEEAAAGLRARAEEEAVGVSEPFAHLVEEIGDLERAIKRLEWAAEALSGATFSLRAGEVVVDASRGHLHESGTPIAEGILFLTDQRLLFEQREAVAVGPKFLPFRRTRQVEEVLLDCPLAELLSVEVGRPLGSLFASDTLNLRLPARRLSLALDGYEGRWQELIEEARGERGCERPVRRAS